MSDDLRERVAEVCYGFDPVPGITWEQSQTMDPWVRWRAHERANAVLAVVDVDGLRAEVERLRAWKDGALMVLSEYLELAQRVVPDGTGIGRRWSDLLAEHIDTVTAQRDAAVRDLAALRAAVEALTGEIGRRSASTAGAVMRAYQRDSDDLRALLADPTPEG